MLHRRPSLPILGLLALATGACAGATQGPAVTASAAPAPAAADRLSGRFMLFERSIGDRHPEVIDFRPNGECVLDFRGRSGIAGHCHANPDGEVTIEGGLGAPVFEGKVRLLKMTLVAGIGDFMDIIYVRVPEPPFLPEAEILGTLSGSNETGSWAQTLRPDHTFQMRVLDLVAEDRRYFELHMDGSFSYAAGVITYRLAHANLPRKDDYLRDFVVRREGRCVWMVDPFNDKLQCQKRAGTMDLPPPPEGYSLGTNPDYSPGDER